MDTIVVTIEKVVNLGVGLAHHDGCVVFVKHACTGDVLSVRVVHVSKKYVYADIERIIKPSKYRVEPACKYHSVCGSCQLMHIDYDHQLCIKRDIVQDALNEFHVPVNPAIPSPFVTRCRRKMQFSAEPTAGGMLIGYYQNMTHKVIDIDSCIMQPETCDQIISFVREQAPTHGISAYDEATGRGDLRHVLIRSSALNGDNLVVLIVNAHKISHKLEEFCKAIFDKCPGIAGVCVNFNEKRNNTILGPVTQCACGNGFVLEQICDVRFKIGASTFFQVNPSSAENLFKYVKSCVSARHKNAVVLDAYAGISAFGFVLSSVCDKVVSVEENEESVALAREVREINGINNVTLHNMDAEKFFADEVSQGHKYDVIVLDPPRKGCTQNSLDYALKLTKSDIVYVSCNPSTLARDLKYLTQNGLRIESIQPFDLFCNTYHVETVCLLTSVSK